jgi:hypothetical protein
LCSSKSGGIGHGSAVPIATTPAARSGYQAASCSACRPPIDSPAMTARSVPVASITAIASSTYSRSL